MELNEKQEEILTNAIRKFLHSMNCDKFIIYDLETNGLIEDPLPSVLSISAEMCKINKNKSIEVIDKYNRFYIAKEGYNPLATKVNGLVDDITIFRKRGDIEYPNYFLDDINSFIEFCKNSNSYMGYNHIAFDNKFLVNNMSFENNFDVMVVQRDIDGFRKKLERLATEEYGIKITEGKAHESNTDVYLTRMVFESMLSMSSIRMVKKD
jgi:DNA polymerase III epsilon subunit-like protein